MSNINVNVAKSTEVVTEAVQIVKNLANTAVVFEEILKPQADISGSEKLQAASRTLLSVKEDFDAKVNTIQRVEEGLVDYMEQLKRITAN